ncbi:hypothetical protein UT300012_23800 [Paraclostridium bifermentans]
MESIENKRKSISLEKYEDIVRNHVMYKIPSQAVRHIYNLIKNNPYQTQSIYVKDLSYQYGYDYIKYMSNFGVLDSEHPMDTLDRCYVIPIDREKAKRIDEYVSNFRSTYLPANAKITHFIVEDNFDNSKEYQDFLSKVTRALPGADCLNKDAELQDIRIKTEVLEEMKSKYKSAGYNNIKSVEHIVKAIDDQYAGNHISTGKILVEMCDEIVKQNPEDTVFYCINENETYLSVAAHLQYFHNRMCITTNKTGRLRVKLGKLFYSQVNMLMEDRINYLTSFPTFAFKVNDFTTFFIVTYKRKVEALLSMFKLNESNMIEEDAECINLNTNFAVKNNLEIIPVTELFNLRANTETELRLADNNLVKLLFDLGKRLGKRQLLVGLQNIVFVRNKETGELFVAYIENLNFSTISFISDTMLGKCEKYVVREDEVFSWLPLDCAACGNVYKGVLAQKLQVYSRQLKGVSDIRTKEIKAKRLARPMTTVFRDFYFNNSNKSLGSKGYNVSDFLEMCLNVKDYVKLRSTNKANIMSRLNMQGDLSNNINCFMGYDAILNKRIVITEKTLSKPIPGLK